MAAAISAPFLISVPRHILWYSMKHADEKVQLGKEFGDDIERAQIEGVMAPGPYVQSLIYEITRLLELRVMKWIVALGFSQQLYDEDEIASVCMYQRAVVWQHLRCLRVLPDPIRESPECAVDEPAAKAVLIRLKWAESIQCLNAACAQVSLSSSHFPIPSSDRQLSLIHDLSS